MAGSRSKAMNFRGKKLEGPAYSLIEVKLRFKTKMQQDRIKGQFCSFET